MYVAISYILHITASKLAQIFYFECICMILMCIIHICMTMLSIKFDYLSSKTLSYNIFKNFVLSKFYLNMSVTLICSKKIYSQQQNYSSTCYNTYDFFSALISIFYHIMIFINSIKIKDHDLTTIYLIKLP